MSADARNNGVNMEMMPERCAHPGCCEPRPLYCMAHVHQQHDPMAQQQMTPDGHIQSQEDHMQQYADMHHHQMHQHQQVQQQPEVCC